jgi:nucleoside-diphosphate-sugar epimerase
VDEPIRKKVLLLGGNGYIGTVLQNSNSDNTFTLAGRGNSKLLDTHFDVVVNMAASSAMADEKQSMTDNYEFPKSMYSQLQNFNGLWIQVASYYELEVNYVRINAYSIHKTKFRKYIEDESRKTGSFEVLSLFLPHIFGGRERENRFIPSIKKLASGQNVEFETFKKIVPLLHIEDAVSGILTAIGSRKVSGMRSLQPFWNRSIEELLTELDINRDSIRNTAAKKPEIDQVNQAIKFPQNLEGFSPKYGLVDLKKDVWKGCTCV